MPSKLTRRGARELTVAIDKIADTVQQNADILGIDPKIATDFAYRSDLISDAVENRAVLNFPVTASEEVEEEEVVEESSKKADFDPNEIAEPETGPLESEPDEAGYMSDHFQQAEFHELGDLQESGGLGKFASLLTAAETYFSDSKSAAMPNVTVQGYDQFTDQIRRLDALNTEAMELQAQIDAAVAPLLEAKAGLDKELKAAHEGIKKEYKDKLSEVGNITIERKTALVEARAMLKVVERKRTATQVQKELMNAISEKYGAEVSEFINETTDALRDTNKTMAIAFKGFELEDRALRTASEKVAGLADLLARFQSLLLKNWRKMVQVVQNAARIVAGSSRSVEKVHGEFMGVAKDIMSGKLASSQLPREAAEEEVEEVVEEEESSKKASVHFNLFQ